MKKLVVSGAIASICAFVAACTPSCGASGPSREDRYSDSRPDNDRSSDDSPSREDEPEDEPDYEATDDARRTRATQTAEAADAQATEDAAKVSRPVVPEPPVIMGDRPVTIVKSIDPTSGTRDYWKDGVQLNFSDRGTWVDIYFDKTVTLTEARFYVYWPDGYRGVSYSGTLTLSFPDRSSQRVSLRGNDSINAVFQLDPTSTDRVRVSVDDPLEGTQAGVGSTVVVYTSFMGRD